MNEFSIRFENPIDQSRLARLREVIGTGPVLIITHNNPDPDGLASGAAFAALFERWGVDSALVYSGLVARAENRAMLKLLTPQWRHAETYGDLKKYSAIVMLDTQPEAGNNSLPAGELPHVVVDHHYPRRKALAQVPFVDVRPEVGATVSLVVQYLDAAGIQPDSILATAIFYGIQADTRALSRGDTPVDRAIYFQMLTKIDRSLLNQVEQAGLPREYFRAFCNGLQKAVVHGRVIVSYLGEIHRPDFVSELADILIRMEETQAVLCIGCHRDLLNLSVRTTSPELDAGLLIQKVVNGIGKGGGHGMAAGGQVTLPDGPVEERVETLVDRFLQLMGETEAGDKLMD